MFPVPSKQKCKLCNKKATGFHPYVGWTCLEHLIWAQKQFCRTMKLEVAVIDYQI